MFTVRVTLKMKDGNVTNTKEAATSVEAFDHYRAATEEAKDQMAKKEIENYMVELIPSKEWDGVLSYHMSVGKK
jgi:hypothetical protein